MWRLVRRAIGPSLGLVAGVAALAYGLSKHAERAFEEQTEEIEIAVSDFGPPGMPPEFAGPPGMPPEFAGPPGMPGMESPPGFPGPPPGMLPFGPPPPRKQKVTQTTIVEKTLLEPAIVRDVTIGGLVREPRGLRRTYSSSGPPPALCPT